MPLHVAEQIPRPQDKRHVKDGGQPKNLGHFWLVYLRMLGHLKMSAHLVDFERISAN